MKSRVLTILSLVVLGSDAWAARTVSMFPMRMSTIAGGSLGGVACVAADLMVSPGNSGVVAVSHFYTVNLRNLSEIPQTVRIVLEKGSAVSSRYSKILASGVQSPVPDDTGKSITVGSDQTYSITLAAASAAAGSTATLPFFVGCTKNSCWIASPGGTMAGTADPIAMPGGSCATSAATCLAADSDLHLRFTVDQDRGAVVGSIATSAHRTCGWKDHFNEPPPFVQINGGRPF